MEYGTIKIPEAEYDRHNERRQEMGLTWAEYIDGQAPDLPTVDEVALADRVADSVTEQLQRELSR